MRQTSWKTSAAGIAAILSALAAICTGVSKNDMSITIGGVSSLVAGIGLLHARDNDKTSEEVGAKTAADSRAYAALKN